MQSAPGSSTWPNGLALTPALSQGEREPIMCRARALRPGQNGPPSPHQPSPKGRGSQESRRRAGYATWPKLELALTPALSQGEREPVMRSALGSAAWPNWLALTPALSHRERELVMRVRAGSAAWPNWLALTPALSHGERELVMRSAQGCEFRPNWLPLPLGEGWGEGPRSPHHDEIRPTKSAGKQEGGPAVLPPRPHGRGCPKGG